jgi:GT2 family glycosyltransferase
MTYRVATIIVTYNSARHIERCLLGLRKASHSAILHTVVVDNASTDETLQIIRRVAGDVEVVTNGVNVGYAEGNNQAIEMLARYGFNYYLILNPDVVVPPGLLHKLLRVMEIDERIGIVSPNVFQGRLDKGHSEIEGMWSLWGVPVRRRPHGAHIWFVDRLPGSCMLIRSSVFEKVGLLDESFFLYWEEIDLCLRARQAGFRLAVCPDAEVLHQPGEPSGAKSERAHRIYYMWRNQVRFAFKNYGTFRGNFFLARRSVTMLKETIQYLRARRMDLLKAGWCGFLAGVQGETGKSDHPLADPDRASSLIAG